MIEPRIRAATAADVPAIVGNVDKAYRHYIARMGKPPGPMLDDTRRAFWKVRYGCSRRGLP